MARTEREIEAQKQGGESEYNGGNPLALPEGFLLDGRYRIGPVLGAGGFGITYLAQESGVRCALKEYVPLGICYRKEDTLYLAPSSARQWEPFEHGKMRFLEEAQVLREIRDIHGVVRILDSFETNGTAYYAMEYLEGLTVRQIQKTLPDRKLRLSDALEVVLVAGTGLDRIHREKHLLHRDISPDNLFYTRSGEVKLIDFGSAKHLSQSQRNVFSVVLKPGYAPPEQYRQRKEQGPYTDEYALAGTFYCLVTGRMPTEAMERVGGKRLPPITELEPGVPEAVWLVVERAMRLRPEERYPSVGRFLEELESAARQAPVKPQASVRPPEPSGRLASPYAQVYLSAGASEKISFPADLEVRVGRARECEIPIRHCADVSRVHLRLRYDLGSGTFLLIDQSSFGTKLENVPLKRGVTYRVPAGSILTLADRVGMVLAAE